MGYIPPNVTHVNRYLTGVSVACKDQELIGQQACPAVSVKHKTGLVPQWRAEDFRRAQFQKRVSGKPSPVITPTLDTDITYACDTWQARCALDPESLANADSELAFASTMTEFMTGQKLLNYEIRVAETYFTTGTWGTDLELAAAADKWSTYATSAPISNFETGKQTVRRAIGKRINMVIIGEEVWRWVRYHPDILDLCLAGGNTGSKRLTPKMVADALELGTLLVGPGTYTVTPETETGGTAAAYTDIWGKNCWMGYVAPKPGLWTPSAAYAFTWYDIVRSWEDSGTSEKYIDPWHSFDVAAVAPAAGYYLYNVVA